MTPAARTFKGSFLFCPRGQIPRARRGQTHAPFPLLFLFSEDYREIEIFVARGLKNHQKGLFSLFADGELADEVEQLRQQAKPTNAPTNEK